MKQGGNPSGGFTQPPYTAAGFTIVETMIVLAVTAVLLISSLALISGRQARTQFLTSANGLQQSIQQIINETTKGYYPNNGSFTCNGGGAPVTFTNAATAQGTNSGCVFLGKILQFNPANPQYQIYPTAGNQYIGGLGGSVATTLTQAQPVAVQVLKQAQNLQGTDFLGAYYDGVSANTIPTYSFGVFSGDTTGTFASSSGSNGLASGSQQFSLYAVVPNGGSCAIHVTSYPGVGNTSCLKNVSSVTVCLVGGDNKTAEISVGNAGGLDVSVSIHSGASCT